jgi:hypothetical protein
MAYKIPISQIKSKNKDAGEYFFERATTRFFKSGYPKDAKVSGDKAYFVTSEINPNGEKKYTIREADLKTGNVRTAEGTEFHAYSTDKKAKEDMNKRFFAEEMPVKKIRKTKEVFVIQGNYGQGWEDVTEEEKFSEAKARLKEYNENESYPHRRITRRVKI